MLHYDCAQMIVGVSCTALHHGAKYYPIYRSGYQLQHMGFKSILQLASVVHDDTQRQSAGGYNVDG